MEIRLSEIEKQNDENRQTKCSRQRRTHMLITSCHPGAVVRSRHRHRMKASVQLYRSTRPEDPNLE